jgi:hypothetical protein
MLGEPGNFNPGRAYFPIYGFEYTFPRRTSPIYPPFPTKSFRRECRAHELKARDEPAVARFFTLDKPTEFPAHILRSGSIVHRNCRNCVHLCRVLCISGAMWFVLHALCRHDAHSWHGGAAGCLSHSEGDSRMRAPTTPLFSPQAGSFCHTPDPLYAAHRSFATCTACCAHSRTAIRLQHRGPFSAGLSLSTPSWVGPRPFRACKCVTILSCAHESTLFPHLERQWGIAPLKVRRGSAHPRTNLRSSRAPRALCARASAAGVSVCTRRGIRYCQHA